MLKEQLQEEFARNLSRLRSDHKFESRVNPNKLYVQSHWYHERTPITEEVMTKGVMHSQTAFFIEAKVRMGQFKMGLS